MVAVQIEVVMYANYRGIPPAFPFYSSFVGGGHRSSETLLPDSTVYRSTFEWEDGWLDL